VDYSNQAAVRHVLLFPPMIERIASDVERYMNLLSVREKLVASNIANADTPGYRTRDIDFQQEYQNAMKSASPEVIEAPGLNVKNDGNNVNLDRESRLLSENDLRFALASNLARSELKSVRMAMDNGSGS
jgi:flagellar basal-body rod protein FlgB